MKKSITYLSLILVGVLMFSCQKAKLEDDDKMKILIGKWEHQMSGYFPHLNQFTYVIGSKQDYSIEFLEGGKLCINDAGETETYRIRYFSEQPTIYGQWRYQIGYGKEKDKLNFQIQYMGEDSIMIDVLPQPAWGVPEGESGFNYFKRIE